MKRKIESLEFKKLSDKAKTPKRMSLGAAGYDLYSAQDGIIPKRGKDTMKTNIAFKIPEGFYGRISGRSSLAFKESNIDVFNGTIDSDYRGDIGIIMFNHSDQDFIVKEGDRIAQIIIEECHAPDLVESEDLEKTERGEGGFGSTGLNDEKKEQ